MAEAAMVLPLLLLCIFATLELGRAANVLQTLQGAAAVGARYSATPGASAGALPSSSAVVGTVDSYLSAAGVPSGNATVTVNQAVIQSENGLSTTFSQINIHYTYSFITPGLSRIVPSIQLSAQASERNQTN